MQFIYVYLHQINHKMAHKFSFNIGNLFVKILAVALGYVCVFCLNLAKSNSKF